MRYQMSLFLEMARWAVLSKVSQRVSQLSRSYIEDWIRGDISIVDRMAQKYENEIHAWKDVVLRTMQALKVDELLDACREARPDLRDLWDDEGARRRLKDEWERAQEYVRGL